ncbi:MAG: hypothetical protein AAGE52_13520 [Myxococcota bacterium]
MSRATRWVWLTHHPAGRVLAFCYDDPAAGPSAKGGCVSDPPTPAEVRAAIDSPDRTVRRPESFGARPIGPEEALKLGLPKDPPWIGFFEDKPVSPPRGEPSRTVYARVLQDGSPVQGAHVRMGYVTGRVREMLTLDQGTTDASGRCEFQLAPLSDSFRTVVAIARCGDLVSRMVDVEENGGVDLTLLAPGELVGTVTRAGVPVLCHLSIWSADGGVHRVERGNGSYRIAGVVPGTYKLEVRGVDPDTRMSAGTPTFGEAVVAPGARVHGDYVLVAGRSIHLQMHTQHDDDSCTGYLLEGEHEPSTSTELYALFTSLGRERWRSTNSSTRKDRLVRAKLLDVPAGVYTLCTQPRRMISGRVPEQQVVWKRVVVDDQDLVVTLTIPAYQTASSAG